ncbi:hypothetical protein D9M72_564080 [compost metagenome]
MFPGFLRDTVQGYRRSQDRQFEADNTDRHGPVAGESRGRGISTVPQLGDCVFDAFTDVRIDIGRSPDNPRHRLLGHPGEPGNIGHPGSL